MRSATAVGEHTAATAGRAPVVEATIQDADGNELASVNLSAVHAAMKALIIQRVRHGKGRLLHYYFNRGGRAVVVLAGEFALPGTLATSWPGHERLWAVRLNPPAAHPAEPQVTAGVGGPTE